MTHPRNGADVEQQLQAALADLRQLREQNQRVADERDAALAKVAGLEKRARNAESMRDTFVGVGVNFAIAASEDAARLVREEQTVADAAVHAAETHGRDLAVIADALGLPPKDGARGVRYDAGVIWWRARTVYLLLRRNGLDAAAEANDANVQPGSVTLFGDAIEPGAERAGALALCGELARMRAFVDSLGARDVPCRCGSGAHPRACERHPWAYRLHVAEMNAESWDEFAALLGAAALGQLARCYDCSNLATRHVPLDEDEPPREPQDVLCDECFAVHVRLKRDVSPWRDLPYAATLRAAMEERK